MDTQYPKITLPSGQVFEVDAIGLCTPNREKIRPPLAKEIQFCIDWLSGAKVLSHPHELSYSVKAWVEEANMAYVPNGALIVAASNLGIPLSQSTDDPTDVHIALSAKWITAKRKDSALKRSKKLSSDTETEEALNTPFPAMDAFYERLENPALSATTTEGLAQ